MGIKLFHQEFESAEAAEAAKETIRDKVSNAAFTDDDVKQFLKALLPVAANLADGNSLHMTIMLMTASVAVSDLASRTNRKEMPRLLDACFQLLDVMAKSEEEEVDNG